MIHERLDCALNISYTACFCNSSSNFIISHYRQWLTHDPDLFGGTESARAYLAEFRKTLPEGLVMKVEYEDKSLFDARFNLLKDNFLSGMFLVFLILMLFLRPALALWVVVGIATAFLGAVWLLPYFDVSLNLLSMFSFLMVLGIVVDDAIIVGESIYSRQHQRMDPTRASAEGTLTVLRPVVLAAILLKAPDRTFWKGALDEIQTKLKVKMRGMLRVVRLRATGKSMKCVGEIIGFAMLVAVLGSMAACSPELQVSESELTSVRKMDVGRLLSVYKSPTCGCCGDWVQHVEDAGFITEVHHPEDLNRLKVDNRIAPVHQSCHTAISKEGYIFEGHIPAKYVYQFLEHPPADAIGLSVPAMPLGSPGMEIDDRFSPYQVLLLKKDGSSEVFARVEDQEEQYQ